MTLAVDDFDAPLTAIERRPNDYKRKGIDGPPYVSSPHGEVVKSGPRKGELKWELYGRPSSFGKQIEDTYNLQRWNERQIVFGLVANPDDETLTQRLIALAGLDPESAEGKDAADAVIVEAKRLAKASLAADRGTHVHHLTEDDDSDKDWLHRAEHGMELGIPHHVQEAMVEAWRLMLVAYDLEVVEIEQAVVHDGYRQAGRLDRIAILRRDITFANGVTLPAGTVIVLDVKSGKLRSSGGTIDYWHSYCVQLVPYAHGVPYDLDTDRRFEWAYDIDRKWAVIAHTPVDEALAGKATCRLVLVDLEAGVWAIENAIVPAKQWQARKDLFAFVGPDEPTIEVPCAPLVDDADPFEGLPNAERERSVRHVFDMPKPRIIDLDTFTSAQLERPKVTDEGDAMTDAQVAEIRKRAGELDPQAKAVLDALAKEANAGGHPFSIGAGPLLRRWHIYRALLRLAAAFAAELDDTIIRATLALVLPEAAQPGVRLGPAIGSLTIDEAMRFVQAAIQVIAQDAVLTIDDAGQPKWLGVGNPAA